MKNNAIIRELKAIDKNTFRMLNGLFGFDFEKPFTVIKVKSPFTVGKCWKALQEKGYDPATTTAVVLMDSTKTTSCWNKYTVTRITYGNDFIVDYKVYRGCDGFHSVWDSFYRKGDFNDRRKLDGVTAYLIAQTCANMQPVKYDRYGCKQEKVDFSDINQRFQIDEHKCRPYNGGDNSEYISGVVVSIKGTKVNHKTYGAYIDGDARNVKDLLQVIDKSGYIALEKRETLKKRANALRKERAAASFKATDNTAILTALHERITALQGLIVEMLADAETASRVDLVRDLLGWNGGLHSIFYDYERIVKKDAEKDFSSIAAFNNALADINATIDKTFAKILNANA